MEKRFEIAFSKGGKFTCTLLMNEAPQTCEAFLKALPLEVRFRQARFAGEEFYFQVDVNTEPENQIPPRWGDIAFNADPKWKAVCVYYGNKVKQSGDPFNLFARIVSGNLEELKKVGERVWIEGEELARIRSI